MTTIKLKHNPQKPMKTIYINGQASQQSGNPSLEYLIKALQLKLEEGGIAVALNQVIIPQEKWAKTYPQDLDRVTVIEAWQGG